MKLYINQMKPLPQAIFEVVVEEENGSSTTHRVGLSEEYYKKLIHSIGLGQANRISPEELVKKSFEFLLEREPKESILREFDLPEIKTYFPEYEERVIR